MNKRFNIGSKYECCPNGNYWQDISGILDREIYLFCDCTKCGGQVYVLRARKATIDKDRLKEIVNDTRNWNRLEEIRDQITIDNMEEILTTIVKENRQ